jgi:hypothetical protein
MHAVRLEKLNQTRLLIKSPSYKGVYLLGCNTVQKSIDVSEECTTFNYRVDEEDKELVRRALLSSC